MSDKIVFDGTIASKVTERLREDIICKRVEAGRRITIKEISERYGVSNMPVREAFRTLEGENLLEINAYKGATVLTLDEEYIRDVYGVLRALEGLLYETALPYMDEDVIRELRAANELMHSYGNSREKSRSTVEMNDNFHNIILARSKNEKAKSLFHYYQKLIHTLRGYYVPKVERIREIATEHDALIAALEAKDLIALKMAVDTHVTTAMENFLAQYAQEM